MSSRLPSRLLDINSLLLRLAGVVALLSIPFKQIPRQVDNLLPINTALTSRYTSFVLGITLLYIASQLARKKRSAYWLSVVGLALLIGAELLHYRNPLQLSVYVAILTSIIKDRRDYVVKSDVGSVRLAIMRASGIIVAVVAFSAILSSRVDVADFGQDLSVAQTSAVFARSLLNLPLPPDIHPRGSGSRIVELLNLAGLTSAVLVGISLFQPLKLQRLAPQSHSKEARRICGLYSTSTEDYLKLWPEDKHYYFYQDSFVAYKVSNGVALILDGVTGKPSDTGRLRPEFMAFAHGNGWSVAIIHANEDEAVKWERYDMQKLFIGSEAAVDCEEFVVKTSRDKHFRYVANRAQKDGMDFELWQPPLSAEQVQQLRSVSDAWLSGGKREYTFIMGYFDEAYLGASKVGVLKQAGQVVAYANLLPAFSPKADSIDHMRSKPGISQVAMHYLLLQIIMARSADGVRELNLGLAPLSKLEDQSLQNLSDRLLPLIKLLGSRYYSFNGLEQFKGKFRPTWEARYVVYTGGLTRLPVVVTALNNATNYKS